MLRSLVGSEMCIRDRFNEYGLDYSGISKTVADKPFVGGIHFLGVGHSFIKFPKTVQTIEFSHYPGANGEPLHSRTLDGLEVALEISFQFKLKVEDLFKLYTTYGTDYRVVYERVANHALTEIATKFTAYDFFMDRTNISNAMIKHLNDEFKKHCYATIDFFQLRSVDLPKDFENAIQLSEVKKQDIIKAYAEKNKTEVELQTKVKVAELQKNVTVNIAQGEAQALLTQNVADAESFKIVQESQSKSYKAFKEGLKMSNEQLLNFIRAKLIRDYSQENIVIAMPAPDTVATKK
eukprot:TRINITY_DN2133_c0_g1_i2.p1 TRINITY_DN2133_c0_g1~~TRINITY_DN2133_c0_g1_i2.p1  ORF type:complete len:293 (-),score=92.04 TRINITY_DN2133_c0_g1_i2:68-946(-)